VTHFTKQLPRFYCFHHFENRRRIGQPFDHADRSAANYRHQNDERRLHASRKEIWCLHSLFDHGPRGRPL